MWSSKLRKERQRKKKSKQRKEVDIGGERGRRKMWLDLCKCQMKQGEDRGTDSSWRIVGEAKQNETDAEKALLLKEK